MIVGSIARRYAKALFSLADEQGQVEQWSVGLDTLGKALAAESREKAGFRLSPIPVNLSNFDRSC